MPGDGCGVRAVYAMFEKDDAGNLRIIARREKWEPAVVAEVLGGVARRCQLTGVGNDLGGAGLARNVVARELRVVPGARAVDHQEETIANRLQMLRLDRDNRLWRWRGERLPPRPIVNRLEQVRRDASAAVG